MGVNGLWTVVSPCARPIKIETLNKKRLAVDASIWIYQFLKAVRDKEGHGLRNSHVVGFFRRICKLLYFGIKPVFVFDGGAPALKRQTIVARKSRREGRREDAARTASKLLALQIHRRAEEEEKKRRQKQAAATTTTNPDDDEEPLPANLVYVEEIGLSPQQRQQQRAKKQFRKTDQYHLPDLGTSLSEMGGANDPRIMSLEELEAYARQFESGEDINVYDFSKIDFDSPFFVSLPASDRYNILNAARLRSRLRMGYSKEQLDTMFPDRMAFSKFQIERVRERNELTQRLMNINGMGDAFEANATGRIAGEKGREYVLVKNEGVEGGWALGVIGDKDKDRRNNPIDVDAIPAADDPLDSENDSTSQDDDFEDIPVEGLNRLPKLPAVQRTMQGDEHGTSAEILRRREALYNTRRSQAQLARDVEPEDKQGDDDSLFVAQDGDASRARQLNGPNSRQAQDAYDEEDEDLKKAIAMSLEPNSRPSSPEADDFEEVFHSGSQDVRNMHSSSQRDGQPAIRRPNNTNSRKMAPNSNPFEDSDEEDDEMDLNAVLAASRQPNPPSKTSNQPPQPIPTPKHAKLPTVSNNNSLFDGPLPFEKLDLGSSLLGKKKAEKIEQDSAGGFSKDLGNSQKKQSEPLPPWFSGDVDEDMRAQKAVEDEDRKRIRDEEEHEEFEFQSRPRLLRDQTPEIIDVDVDGDQETTKLKSNNEPISPRKEESGRVFEVVAAEEPEVLMDDVADLARARPPMRDSPRNSNIEEQHDSDKELSGWEDSDTELGLKRAGAGGVLDPDKERSSSPEFEDVVMPKTAGTAAAASLPLPQLAEKAMNLETEGSSPIPYIDEDAGANEEGEEDEEGDIYGAEFDDSDEELMLQLATEAEEHARFASSLNQKSQEENIAEYERELKALRNQQKKDRRDADEVTQVMITECQQLLQLFGLPYITAPMEAEAQCAELVTLGLVDGIVTDDSDIFLFGGTRIYKNMFNQAKFVECYLSSDLEREFDLTRERMIRIAHLLGSDYTEGLPGVGPVTALEIISEFPYGLADFKAWWTGVQQGTLEPGQPGDENDDDASQWRRKFKRTQATKLFLSPIFPDQRVDQAYLKPDVDSDPQPFQWGIPDLDRLRAFLMATIGWSQERTDEVLVPVIKDINRRDNEGTQSNITNFVTTATGTGTGTAALGAGAFAPRKRDRGKSRRMETALEKMAARAREKRRLAPITNSDTRTATASTDALKDGKKKKDREEEVEEEEQSDSLEEDEHGSEDDDSFAESPRTSKRKAKKAPTAAARKKAKRSNAAKDSAK